jgi:DNA-binding CsgD family transcriptional regulator
VVTRAVSIGAPAAGVLILDKGRRPSGWTPGALRWLDEGNGVLGRGVVDELVDELVALERRGVPNPTASTTFPAADLWIAAQAMRLQDGRIVVSVGPAPANQVVELLACRYGLTGREQEIVDLLARGLDTRAVTRELSISRYTLQDHLKSIFAKTGVNTRLKLVALVSAALSAQLPGA